MLSTQDGTVFTGLRDISAGSSHVLAIDSNGYVISFGDNTYGELGNGTTGSSAFRYPLYVLQAGGSRLGKALAVYAGNDSSFAVLEDHTVRAWGHPHWLGVGSATTSSFATEVRDEFGQVLADVRTLAVAPDGTHTLALTGDGSLYVWGQGISGSLCGGDLCLTGDGTSDASPHAVPVRNALGAPITHPRSFAVGLQHTVVVQSDGTVLTWGKNQYGQLGDGTTTIRPKAQYMLASDGTPIRDVVAVHAADNYTLLITADGSVWTVGSDHYGVIGDGQAPGDSSYRTYPVQVIEEDGTPLSKVIAASIGRNGVVVKKSDGSYWSWGLIAGCELSSCTSATVPVLKAKRSLLLNR